MPSIKSFSQIIQDSYDCPEKWIIKGVCDPIFIAHLTDSTPVSFDDAQLQVY
jgi:hypothetical protein